MENCVFLRLVELKLVSHLLVEGQKMEERLMKLIQLLSIIRLKGFAK